MKEKKSKLGYDLTKLNQSYESASISNADLANDAIMRVQNWFLIVALAELAFLSRLLFNENEGIVLFVKINLFLLIFLFLFFLIGGTFQFYHALNMARGYNSLIGKVTNHMKKINSTKVSEIPKSLIEKNILKTSSRANLFFNLAMILFLIVNLNLMVGLFLIF